MPFVLIHLFAYVVCFGLVWWGAGKVVTAVATLASYWKLPAFTVSFFILGAMTSLPEIAIGSVGLINDDPQIFAGNLIGASLVIFLLIIPLLSLVGKGIKFPKKQVNHKELLVILTVVLAPTFLSADRRISYWEGWLLILLYGVMAVVVTFRHSVFESITRAFTRKNPVSLRTLGSILIGTLVLFLASRQIVTSTLFFAEVLSISPFFVSLVLISLGTNVPEFSIIVRSVLAKKSEIALADYLGSASINSLLFGVFTLINGETFSIPSQLGLRVWFVLIGLALFFIFARTKDRLSRRESAVLLTTYVAFVVYEVWQNIGL